MHKITYILLLYLTCILISISGCETDSTRNTTMVPIDTASSINNGGLYYVAVNGNDKSTGTFENPFATLQKAVDIAKAGDVIYVRGGVFYADPKNKYYHTRINYLIGTERNPIKIWAYPGEKPILDCSTLTSEIHNYGIEMFSSCWIYLKGLEIVNVPQRTDYWICAGIYGSGDSYAFHHNTFQNMVIHNVGGAGIIITGNAYDNLIKDCDVYNNYDAFSLGKNADGIDIATTDKGATNRIAGCRVWYNSDDGYDFWDNEGVVIMDSCWSFLNGYIPGTKDDAGDGMGIKLEELQPLLMHLFTE